MSHPSHPTSNRSHPTPLPRPLKDIAITAKKRYNLFQEHSVITLEILSNKYETSSHKKILYGIYQDMLRQTQTTTETAASTAASSKAKKKRTSKKMKNAPSKEKSRKVVSSSDITECAEKAI